MTSDPILPGDPPIPLVLRRSARARRISLRISQLDGRVTLTMPKRLALAEAMHDGAGAQPEASAPGEATEREPPGPGVPRPEQSGEEEREARETPSPRTEAAEKAGPADKPSPPPQGAEAEAEAAARTVSR